MVEVVGMVPPMVVPISIQEVTVERVVRVDMESGTYNGTYSGKGGSNGGGGGAGSASDNSTSGGAMVMVVMAVIPMVVLQMPVLAEVVF